MKVPVTSSKPGAGYDAAVTAINTNLVHRWKFQESSGDFADSVGSLTLAATGTFIYGVPGPIDSAVAFQASAKGLSTGLGSIPTGSGQRTVVVVYKPTKGTNPKQALCSYGTTGSTRQYFVMSINDAVVDTETFAVWSDDITVAAAGGSGYCWHVFVARVDSGGTSGKMFNDYLPSTTRTFGAALNTGTGVGFTVGQETTGGTNQFLGYIDDIAIWSRALTDAEILSLVKAAGIGQI
jgi:hypothetical protein